MIFTRKFSDELLKSTIELYRNWINRLISNWLRKEQTPLQTLLKSYLNPTGTLLAIQYFIVTVYRLKPNFARSKVGLYSE